MLDICFPLFFFSGLSLLNIIQFHIWAGFIGLDFSSHVYPSYFWSRNSFCNGSFHVFLNVLFNINRVLLNSHLLHRLFSLCGAICWQTTVSSDPNNPSISRSLCTHLSFSPRSTQTGSLSHFVGSKHPLEVGSSLCQPWKLSHTGSSRLFVEDWLRLGKWFCSSPAGDWLPLSD